MSDEHDWTEGVVTDIMRGTPTPEGEPGAWQIGQAGALYRTYKEARSHTDAWKRENTPCAEPRPLYARPDPAVERLQRELEEARAKLREAEDDAHMYLERVNQNAYAGQSEEMWQSRATAAEASLVKAREALTYADCIPDGAQMEVERDDDGSAVVRWRTPTQSFSLSIFPDGKVVTARAILGDQP